MGFHQKTKEFLDFWQLYKRDSILYSIIYKKSSVLIQLASPVGAFLAEYFSVIPKVGAPLLMGAILLAINASAASYYWYHTARKPIHIFGIQTWDREVRTHIPYETPTVKPSWTVVRVYVRFRPKVKFWRMRILSSTETQLKKRDPEWSNKWKICHDYGNDLGISCDDGTSFFDFSLFFEMRWNDPYSINVADLEFFIATDRRSSCPISSEKLVKKCVLKCGR